MSDVTKSQHIYLSGKIVKKEEKNDIEYNITIESGDVKNTFSLAKKKTFSDLPVGTHVTIGAAPWKDHFFILNLFPNSPKETILNEVIMFGRPILIKKNSCLLATELGCVSCFFTCENAYDYLCANEAKEMKFWGELHNNNFYIKGGSYPL